MIYKSEARSITRHRYGEVPCRKCVQGVRHAIAGRGEYIVYRCGRCNLRVDTRLISQIDRTIITNNHDNSVNCHKVNRTHR